MTSFIAKRKNEITTISNTHAQQVLTCSKSTEETVENKLNIFKANNKGTRTTQFRTTKLNTLPFYVANTGCTGKR